ncbi:MAG: 4-hydroxybenzoate polyprenyltransferase [Patiriisocius sp.]|jgi:4-hydroxybenzoate polyprenyltransferase
MIALMMALIKYAFLETIGIDTYLSNFQFILLILSVLLIAAGGNVINDVYDIANDRINKADKIIISKKISIANATSFYIFLTATGVVLGFLLSNWIDHKGLSVIFVITAALLYSYATSFKNLLLLGNIIISLLVAFSLVTVILFDIYPGILDSISTSALNATRVIMHYALFAFGLNFIREITKDIHDVDGDKKAGRNTLPIVIGRKRAGRIVVVLLLVFTAGCIYYLYEYFYNSRSMLFYFLFAVIGPLLFAVVKSFQAKTKKEFALLSTILKFIMLLGVISIAFYPI